MTFAPLGQDIIDGATLLDLVPPVTPAAMGRATRGVELASRADLDRDRDRIAAWMRQVTAVPGLGGARRRGPDGGAGAAG